MFMWINRFFELKGIQKFRNWLWHCFVEHILLSEFWDCTRIPALCSVRVMRAPLLYTQTWRSWQASSSGFKVVSSRVFPCEFLLLKTKFTSDSIFCIVCCTWALLSVPPKCHVYIYGNWGLGSMWTSSGFWTTASMASSGVYDTPHTGCLYTTDIFIFRVLGASQARIKVLTWNCGSLYAFRWLLSCCVISGKRPLWCVFLQGHSLLDQGSIPLTSADLDCLFNPMVVTLEIRDLM